jgi:uncharacterized protein YjdB
LQVVYRDAVTRQWLEVRGQALTPALAVSTPSVVTFEPVIATGVRLDMTFAATGGAIAEVVLGPATVPEPAYPAAVAADLAAIDIPYASDVRSNVSLPLVGPLYGTTITWQSSNPAIVSDEAADGKAAGVVTRQASADRDVTLTATATRGSASASRSFQLTVKRADPPMPTTDYLFAHFTGPNDPAYVTDEQIYFATSRDGANFQDMTPAGSPVLSTAIGDRGVRDPYLVRAGGGGRAYLIATDLSVYYRAGWSGQNGSTQVDYSSTQIVVWETTDMVNWEGPRLAEVAGAIPDSDRLWAPEAFWDEATGQFYIYWSAGAASTGGGIFIASTRDFVTFSYPQLWMAEGGIDATVVKTGDTYYRAHSSNGIRIAQGDAMLGNWSELTTLQNIMAGHASVSGYLEGPEFFQYNTDDYPGTVFGLLADNPDSGYRAWRTTDIGDTTRASWEWAGDMSFGPVTKRHGTILPITAAEYEGIMAEYGHAIVDVEAITLSGPGLADGQAVVPQGETLGLTASVEPSNATAPSVFWASSDPAVAAVDFDGVIEATGYGIATVTATAKDGSGVTSSVTITVPPPAPTLSKPKLTGSPQVGQSLTVGFTATPSVAEGKVVWYRIDGDGKPVKTVATDQLSYTLTTDDLAAGAVKVKVTAVNPDGAFVVKYSDTVAVTAATSQPVATPSVKTAVLTLNQYTGQLRLAYTTNPANYPAADVTIRWYTAQSVVKEANGLTAYTPAAPGLYKVKLTLVGSTVARYSNGVQAG